MGEPLFQPLLGPVSKPGSSRPQACEGSVCLLAAGCVSGGEAQTQQRPGGGKAQVTQGSVKDCLEPQVCMEQSGMRGFLDQGPLPAKSQCHHPVPFSFPDTRASMPQHCHGEAREPQGPGGDLHTYRGGRGGEGHLRTKRHLGALPYLLGIPGLNECARMNE